MFAGGCGNGNHITDMFLQPFGEADTEDNTVGCVLKVLGPAFNDIL